MSEDQKLIEQYQRVVNKIDDYLEYRYTKDSKEDIRAKILTYIDGIGR